MFSEAFIQSLQIYGISIVIAMLVVVLLKVMVMVMSRLERTFPADAIPVGTVCPVLLGISDEDVAALVAAIFVAMGSHHILHISRVSHTWASHGRAAQHFTDITQSRPKH